MKKMETLQQFIDLNQKQDSLLAKLEQAKHNLNVYEKPAGRDSKPASPRKPNTPKYPFEIYLHGALAALLAIICLALLIAHIVMFAGGKIGMIILAAVSLCTFIAPYVVFLLIKLIKKRIQLIQEKLNEYKKNVEYYKAYPTIKAKYDKAYKKWEIEDLALKKIIEDIEKEVTENEKSLQIVEECLQVSGYNYREKITKLYNTIRNRSYGFHDYADDVAYLDKHKNDDNISLIWSWLKTVWERTDNTIFDDNTGSLNTRNEDAIISVVKQWNASDSTEIFVDKFNDCIKTFYLQYKNLQAAIENILGLLYDSDRALTDYATESERIYYRREKQKWALCRACINDGDCPMAPKSECAAFTSKKASYD